MKRAHTQATSDQVPTGTKNTKTEIEYYQLKNNKTTGQTELGDGSALTDKTVIEILWPNGKKTIYKISIFNNKPQIIIKANDAQITCNLDDITGGCRFRIIDNDFNKSVREYLKIPSYDNFIKISDNCKPEMVRGLINADNYGKDLLLECDITHLALVYCGYKPICKLQSIPPVFYKLGLKVLKVERISNIWGFGWGNSSSAEYIIWKSDSQDKNAKEFATFLEKDVNSSEWQNSSRIIGRYLGYPETDIDYFIKRK